MKTCAHLWYLAEFFLEWEYSRQKLQRKSKHFYWFSIRKSSRLRDNVEKFGRARQDTDDNIVRRMRVASCITKATDTHSEYVRLVAFPLLQWLRELSSVWSYTYVACIVINLLAAYIYSSFCIIDVRILKFYWIKPSLHNIIDSCYSTTGYISNMFRPYLAIIRLTKVSIN